MFKLNAKHEFEMCFSKLSFKPVSLETVMVSNISVMFKKIKNGKRCICRFLLGIKWQRLESPSILCSRTFLILNLKHWHYN